MQSVRFQVCKRIVDVLGNRRTAARGIGDMRVFQELWGGTMDNVFGVRGTQLGALLRLSARRGR